MTGQVDEAGREAAVEALRARMQLYAKPRIPDGSIGWGASIEEIVDCVLEASGVARLAGQVAAIRALHGKVPEPFLDGERYSCSTCTDGEGNAIDWPCPTLVASSPTTPEAPK